MTPLIVVDARGGPPGSSVSRYARELLPALLAECAACRLPIRVLLAADAPAEARAAAGPDAELVVSRAAWMDATSEALWLPRETRGASLVHSLSGHWIPDDVPGVVTIHDLIASARPDLATADGRYLGARVMEAARRAALRLPVSTGVADQLRRLFGPAAMPLAVVPLAAAPIFHRARPGREAIGRYGVLPGAYLLAVGDYSHPGHLATLHEAYMASGVGSPLMVAGVVPRDADRRWRQAGPPGRSRRILTPGMVPDEDLAALYAGCRVFISASWESGAGLPVLEAMAAGAPVVTTHAPGGAEVGDEAACWVPPGDAGALARAIAALDADPARRADLGRRGRIRAGQYSWARTASMTVGVYSALALARAA